MKTSTDRGQSWGKAQFLTDKGYANAKAIFDEQRNNLVVQYSRNKPAAVFQITSKDHGKTWSKQVEIKEATECGGGGVGGGGQRTMTEGGRMLWYSDAPGCIWYSDDGGKTYGTFKGVNGWNEASFVSIAQHSIYANGRAHGNKPNRVNYKSHDDGKSWTSSESDLKDPVTHGEVRGTAIGLAAGHIPDGGTTKTIYESEPVGIDGSQRETDPAMLGGRRRKGGDCPGRACARARLTLRCSLDGGKSFPYSIVVNGDHRAEYSALHYFGTASGPQLLVAWTYLDNFDTTAGEHILTSVYPIDWCKGGK